VEIKSFDQTLQKVEFAASGNSSQVAILRATLDPSLISGLQGEAVSLTAAYKGVLTTLQLGKKRVNQCCGSGSRIRCVLDPWIRDPVWVKSKDPDPGCGMNNPDNIS
jgi:hypothetical protein